jgi:transcriptional regulator
MYIPDLYQNHNQADIEQFIQENSFAILIYQINDKLTATHIPLIFEKNNQGEKTLTGHISIENPQAVALKNDDEVLVIFNGPHSYISSSWYDHENVPTWNYLAVHIYGKIKILNLNQTIESLKVLVDKYERNSIKPVKVEDFSKKTMLQAKGILGFEIKITKTEATKKLSQNRDDYNYQNIISELVATNKSNEISIANEMKRCPR